MTPTSRPHLAATLLLLALTACATGAGSPQPSAAGPTPVVEAHAEVDTAIPNDWRTVASPADRERVERVDEAWAAALATARTRGHRRKVDAEGELLQPAAALPRPAPTPGSYRCRAIKLGGAVGFRAFPPYFCYVEAEGDLLILDKQTGSERPRGRVWADGDQRLIFLGALELGGERTPPAYGEKPERNVAGVVERVGPFRWRLVMPATRPGASLDVLEMVPAPQSIRSLVPAPSPTTKASGRS